MATDVGYTLGKLKEIDLKAVVVDATTGKLIYHNSKPVSTLRKYGGNYIALDPQTNVSRLQAEIMAIQDDNINLVADRLWENDPQKVMEYSANTNWIYTLTQRIAATKIKSKVVKKFYKLDEQARDVDGVDRKVHAPYIAPWLEPYITNNSECLDDWWSMYVRNSAAPAQVPVVPIRRSWTRLDGEGALLPEWSDNNVTAANIVGYYTLVCRPRDRTLLDEWPIKFNYTARAGFFVPGFNYIETTSHLRWKSEIDALEAETPDSVILERIATVKLWIAEHSDRAMYAVPRSVFNRTFTIDKSPAQLPPKWPMDDKPKIQGPGLTPWTAPTTRAVVAETGPVAWIAVSWSFLAASLDGPTRWAYPSTRNGLLGVNAGALDYENLHPEYVNAFGITGGGVYASGWRTWADEGGSYGFWEVKPIVTTSSGDVSEASVALIKLAAPTEAQDMLLENAGGFDAGWPSAVIYRGHKIYASRVPVTDVRLKFKLTFFAFDVYRVGLRTVEFGGGLDQTSTMCPKTDAGFNMGNNCEGSLCGNITCNSTISGNKYKLYSTDPLYAKVKKTVLTGEVICTPKANPYPTELLHGLVMKCDVIFDLNNNLRAFDIPLYP